MLQAVVKANKEVLALPILAVPLANVRELFVHELGDTYDAEHRFLEGQCDMVQEATGHGTTTLVGQEL